MSGKSLLARLSTHCVRRWVRLYTLGLPDSIRHARLAEIESDLWEGHHESDDPFFVFSRLVRGMVDDFQWRVDHMARQSHPALRALALSLGVVILLSTLWAGLTLREGSAPQPPAAPDLISGHVPYPPPPPPPPPPPCNPPGIGRAPFAPCTAATAVPAK